MTVVTRPVLLVPPSGDGPLGTRLLAAAGLAPAGVVVLAAEGATPVPEERLLDLLHGPYRVGAVVPGTDPEVPARDLTAHEARSPSVAMRSALVATAGIDPTSDDPLEVAACLLRAASAAGRRVVADPAWAGLPAGPPPRPAGRGSPGGPERLESPWPDPPGDDGIRVLLVTGPILSERFRIEDRAAAELIRSVARLADPSQVTVMTTERVPPAQRRRWAAAGLEVLEGPEAWTGGPGADDRLYSHVILTSPAAGTSVRSWVEARQPHAARIVYFASLDARDVRRVGPISAPDETEGLETVHVDVEDHLAHVARWAHAVWCQWPEDAGVIRGWAPGVPVVEIPPVLTIDPTSPGREGRRGVLLVAAEGHDVLGGHEDAVLRGLGDVIGQIRGRDPSVGCTVVTERPTPLLAARCEETGARTVPEASFDEELSRARVVLACHGYGGGQPAVLMTAIERGVPVVCTPWATGDLDLGTLAGMVLGATDEDLAARTWQLLSSDARWAEVRADEKGLAGQRYPAGRHDEAVRTALAALGVTPVEGPPEWPPVAGPEPLEPPFSNPRLPIRPDGIPEPGPLPSHVPTDERRRYQLWHRRHGPVPEVLEAIRAELDRVTHRPLISILMPVYNTDADVLSAAVASVRAQLYDRWELCVANDGSDRPETLEVLDTLRGEPNMVIVDRDAPSGISEATNAALAVARGDYVTFLDHDDELKPHALAQVVRWLDADPGIDVLYTDEDKLGPDGDLYDPHIKPDWAPDQLTAQNYVCHLTVARRSLVEKVGGLRREFDGSQDYDLILRLTERTDRIAHIPEPLYSWRAVPGSAAAVADAKPYAIEAAQRAVADALARRGYGSRVDTTERIGFFRPRYPLRGSPKVSIIVPTRNGRPLLERCLGSILEKSTYRNYEIVIVDNGSTDGPSLEYMASGAWRVVRYPHRFNYARMMNLAARSVECDALLFLNNDTEIITPDWIEGLLEHAMRPEIGAVGGRLYYGDGAPQHEGILLGIGGFAHNTNHYGYWARGELTRNVSAVTGACTMMRPSVYWRVGGNDERLRIAYNDVDLCLRVHQAGYQVVYTPYVELYHHESATRGKFEHHAEGPLFGARWRVKETVDPYYSPMFEDFPPFLIRL